VINRSRRVGGQ